MASNNARQIFPPDIDIVEIESSNDTASDNPGPGRLLGKLYDYLGKHLELGLCSIAERIGSGPLVVAQRIRNRQREYRHSEQHTRDDANKQAKDCSKLICFTKSKVESTRKQALESIVDLSIGDKHVFDLLKTLNAARTIQKEEPYVWEYCDESVVLSSRMALACLQERQIFNLVMSYEKPGNFNEKALVNFIRTRPEDSFLALRLFRVLLGCGNILFSTFEIVLENVAQLIDISPDIVERAELDKILWIWVNSTISGANNVFKSRLLRYPHLLEGKLLINLKEIDLKWWLSDLSNPVNYVAYSTLNWVAQNAVFENWPEQLAKSSVFYQCLLPFLNPCDMALSRIAAVLFLCPSLPYCEEDFTADCKILVRTLSSEDEYIKQRALVCVKLVLRHDVHSRRAMLNALSMLNTQSGSTTMNIRISDQLSEFVRRSHAPKADYNISFFETIRHCDKDGNLIHIFDGLSCFEECAVVHRLVWHPLGILTIKFSRGTPVRLPPSFIPIVAGHFRDGRPALLAIAYDSESDIKIDCCVVEGTKPEDLCVRRQYNSSEIIAPEAVAVVVLRYALEAYSKEYFDFIGANGAEVLDATGPFAWTFERYLS